MIWKISGYLALQCEARSEHYDTLSCEWSTHINTPQHFSVCCPVHVYSDPASRHVLVSLHPHARDHSSNALALAQGHTEKGHLLYTCAFDIVNVCHGSGAIRSIAAAVMAESLQRVGEQPLELSVEERNLLSVAYGSIINNRHAAWRIIVGDEQKEKFKGMEQQASHAREHVAKVEGEIQRIRDGIPALMDENLIPSSSTGESKEKGLITCVINRLQTSTDLKEFDMVTAVRRLAEQGHSAALSQLGSHISAIMKFGAGADDDPFVKVNDLIMDFSRLQAEASSETNQKSHCDEETSMAAEKEDLEDDTAKHSSPLETAVPDACLSCDTKCKVANETCVKDNMFMITGEFTVAGKLHRETDVRGIVRNIGIDSFIDDLNRVDNKGLHHQDCEVLFHVSKQRADIAESLTSARTILMTVLREITVSIEWWTYPL